MAAADNRKKVINILNKARAMELHAIMQYMNHHYGLDDMDYSPLAKEVKKIAIDEMRHAEMLAERIKEIDGEPVAAPEGKVKPGQSVKEVFPTDRELEDGTIKTYNDLIKQCRELGDNISAELIKSILVEEQEHWNYFDDQVTHIKTLGDAYLAQLAAKGSAD